MAGSADYVVTYKEGRWQVRTPKGYELSYSTQQAAVEAAKSSAAQEQVDVKWTDRDGRPQGHARFRRPQQASIVRSLSLRSVGD